MTRPEMLEELAKNVRNFIQYKGLRGHNNSAAYHNMKNIVRHLFNLPEKNKDWPREKNEP